MDERLNWDEISQKFNKEWIELTDYDWPDGEVNPKAGVVRVHSPDRKEFYRLMKELEPKPEDSALVFVGTPEQPADTIMSSTFMIVPCEQ